MAKFEIKGEYLLKEKPWKFTKEIEAINENMAREKTLALMGSKHKLKRNKIKINAVKELKEAK
jgi:large subunit ribosomal protein LX